ncbi:MAG TPA: hypothetical protein VGN09_13455 [Vicinamibacteria bacterium]|jgi:hypothetical protein
MSRGSDFIKAVLAEHEPTIAERVLLEEVGATLDALADPSLGDTAKRQHRLILSRLLGQLDIRGEGDEAPKFVDGVSIRAKRASDIRWRREKAAS